MATGSNPGGDLREQPIGELFKHLSDDLSTLVVRQELKLAQAEMTEKGKKAGIGAGLFGGAGIVGVLTLGTLTACVVGLLAPPWIWVAALIMTVVYGALAGVLALTGKKRMSEATPPVPEQTVETVKEDVQWAKTQLPSGSN
jgi:uncharacterized membrane protein YqjE